MRKPFEPQNGFCLALRVACLPLVSRQRREPSTLAKVTKRDTRKLLCFWALSVLSKNKRSLLAVGNIRSSQGSIRNLSHLCQWLQTKEFLDYVNDYKEFCFPCKTMKEREYLFMLRQKGDSIMFQIHLTII